MSPATPRSTIKSRPPFAFPFKRRDHVHRASGSVDSVLSVTSTVGVYSPLIRLLKSAVYTVASDHSLAILSLDDLTCRYVLGTMTARIEWVQWVLDDGVLVVGSGDGLAQRWRLSGGSGALEEYGAVPYPGNSGGAALVDNIDASAIRPSLWLADWLDIRTQQQQQCAVFAASMSSTPMITVNIKRLLTLVDHEIALDTHEDTAHDYIHASDKSTATVIAHVVRQVCGLLFPWRVDATLDKLADDAKLMRYGVGHGATTVLVMRGVQQQLGCVLPHVAKGQQWIANIQSPQASALRLCTLMALLKKLLVATKSGINECDGFVHDVALILVRLADPQPIQALIDTMPHTVSQLLTTSAMQPPALSFLAKFNNDPSTQHISEIQSSAHDLFAITLKHTPPAHLHLLVAFWYNRLPSVNFDIRMLKAMVRACATLGALAEEELSYANHGVSLADCVVIHHDAAPDASVTAGTHVVLGSAIKEEISKSIAILLTTNIDDKDQAAKLCAVNLLGSGWPLWQDVLANMPMSVVLQISEPSMASKVHQYHRQHSGISLGIPSEPNHPHAHLPVNVVILRTLMRFAVMSSKSQQQKDQQLPDNKPVYKTNVARRLRRLRIGAKHVNEAFVVEVDGKNSAERTAFNNLDIPSSALDPTMISLNNAATDARGRGSDKPGIPYRSRSLPRLQQSVLPLEEPIDAELQREFTKILSLPQIARQALMNVAAASWTMFFAIVCAELVMAGIKEGDWERVRTAMRAGVVLTTRMVGKAIIKVCHIVTPLHHTHRSARTFSFLTPWPSCLRRSFAVPLTLISRFKFEIN